MIDLSITPQRKARLEGHPNELHALVRAIDGVDGSRFRHRNVPCWVL